MAESVHKTSYSVTSEALEKMNGIAARLARDHFPRDVFIWDSHLQLQQRYKEICLRYRVPSDAKRMWSCHDTLHSGTIIYNHYAQMLLNFLCNND